MADLQSAGERPALNSREKYFLPLPTFYGRSSEGSQGFGMGNFSLLQRCGSTNQELCLNGEITENKSAK